MTLSPKTYPEKIFEIIKGIIPGSVFRVDDSLAWEHTIKSLGYIPVSYSNSWIDYQLAYQRGRGGNWWDVSLILVHDRRACGIWPLTYSQIDSEYLVSSQGLPILPPLFKDDFKGKVRKSVVKQCIELLEKLCQMDKINSYDSAESFYGQANLSVSEWHEQLMGKGATVGLKHELFVDLSLDIELIKTHFRKSYKPLINAGLRDWKVELVADAELSVWQEFRELHLAVAGRVTRSSESWELQYKAMSEGDAFCVVLRDQIGRMVGCGYFNLTSHEGVYSVAAYDRSLFDKPLGHTVQFVAIQEMKKRGLRWYKIGARPYRSETPTPSEKEVSIADFKQGFATHVVPQYLFRIQVPSKFAS